MFSCLFGPANYRYAEEMNQGNSQIHVVWNPPVEFLSEEAVISVFEMVLNALDQSPVDN
jgi:hypothetical protein